MIDEIFGKLMERDFTLEFENFEITHESLTFELSGRIKISVRKKNENKGNDENSG
jgi:hypothetical protein